jgi:S1-C subfamily serine protease
MHWFTDILVGLLATYMLATNFIADRISTFFPDQYQRHENLADQSVDSGLITELPSLANIPDILRRSLPYQSALLSDATAPSTAASNPLDALVNIFCTFTTDTTIRTTTGTGFFVHSGGVILTNAHVAQYLLIAETGRLGQADCTIRGGNPASPLYRAGLLYISPAWVLDNAALIDVPLPSGTGERDYALLYVTESLSREPLPALFPSLALNTSPLPHTFRNNNVFAAGYPANDLATRGAAATIIPRLASTSISELYTFGSNLADVISIRGSVVGAQGSSGGPVLSSDGKVIGLIVTRGDDATDGDGSLRAITISHVSRTIEEETGFSLDRNISGNLPLRSKLFSDTLAPFLRQLLVQEIKP